MSRRTPEWAIVQYKVRCSHGHDVERGQVVRWGMRMATCATCLAAKGEQVPSAQDLRVVEGRET